MTLAVAMMFLFASFVVCVMCVIAMAAGMRALMPSPSPDLSSLSTTAPRYTQQDLSHLLKYDLRADEFKGARTEFGNGYPPQRAFQQGAD